MPAPISTDLRVRILRDCDAGMKNGEVAEKFSVSIPFVKKLKQQRARTGSIEPKPHGGGRKRALAGREAEIREIVEGGEVATVADVHEKLGADCTPKTVWLEMRRLGYRFKKRR